MAIDRVKFGESLKELRTRRKMTQKDLAELCEVTVPYISLLESGHRTVSIDTLNSLAEALRLPAEMLSFLGSSGEFENPKAGALAKTTEDAIWNLVDLT